MQGERKSFYCHVQKAEYHPPSLLQRPGPNPRQGNYIVPWKAVRTGSRLRTLRWGHQPELSWGGQCSGIWRASPHQEQVTGTCYDGQRVRKTWLGWLRVKDRGCEKSERTGQQVSPRQCRKEPALSPACLDVWPRGRSGSHPAYADPWQQRQNMVTPWLYQ